MFYGIVLNTVRYYPAGVGNILAIVDSQLWNRKIEHVSAEQLVVFFSGRIWIHAFANDQTRYGGYADIITCIITLRQKKKLTYLIFIILFLGVALNDSPAGLAAYILEKFSTWTNSNNKHLPDGGLSKYDTDELLDNVMIYWITGSMTTSMRLYAEFASKTYRDLPLNKYICVQPIYLFNLNFKFHYAGPK